MSENEIGLGLEKSLLIVNAFRAEVCPLTKELGRVCDSEFDDHEQEVRHLFEADSFASNGDVVVSFAHPRRLGTTISDVHAICKEFGFRPAGLHETVAVLQSTDREQIRRLFRGIDIARNRHNSGKLTQSLAVVCLGSYVRSPTAGQLTPVLSLEKGWGSDGRLHLMKVGETDCVRPAQMIPLVKTKRRKQ